MEYRHNHWKENIEATLETVEEAYLNSLLAAEDMEGKTVIKSRHYYRQDSALLENEFC